MHQGFYSYIVELFSNNNNNNKLYLFPGITTFLQDIIATIPPIWFVLE